MPLHREIERRWLLAPTATDLRATLGSGPRRHIQQGWLPTTVLKMRVRRSLYLPGNVVCELGTKIGEGIERIEVEEEIPQALYMAMFQYTTRRIEKMRYAYAHGERTWELDDFRQTQAGNYPFFLLEVELPTKDTPVEIPTIFTPHIVKEVTDDSNYTNYALAQRIT